MRATAITPQQFCPSWAYGVVYLFTYVINCWLFGNHLTNILQSSLKLYLIIIYKAITLLVPNYMLLNVRQLYVNTHLH